MKVISEYTIKKLIQVKLLENYKKKLLKEEDNSINKTDFQNQIISTGIIEALYLFLTEPDFNNALQGIGISTLIKNSIPAQLDNILKSKNKAEFVQKNNVLLQTLSAVLNTQPDILNTTLFTHLIAYDDIILEKFNEKMEDIKSNKAFVTQGDLNVIENHLTKGITYTGFGPFKGIKDTIREMISGLLAKPAKILTATEVMNKIANLLPVLNLSQNQQNNANGETPSTNSTTTSQVKKTTPQQIMNVGFAELKDNLSLSQRQLKKLSRQIKKTAEKRTNSPENSKRYQALLTLLTLKQVIQAPAFKDMPAFLKNAGQQFKDKILNDVENQLIETLKEKENNNPAVVLYFKNFNSEILNKIFPKVIKDKKFQAIKNKENKQQVYRSLSYILFTDAILNLTTDINKYGVFEIKDGQGDITIINEELKSKNILIKKDGKHELIKIADDMSNKIQKFFNDANYGINEFIPAMDFSMITNPNNHTIVQMAQWLEEFFDSAEIREKYLEVNLNLIKFIKLKFLEKKDIDIATETLKTFNKIPLVSDTFEKVEETDTTSNSNSITSEKNVNATATTTAKECFKKNKGLHTDNFKLYPSKKIDGVRTADEYVSKIAGYLLDSFSVPENYGFINKDVEQESAYTDKLQKAGLNVNKIAEALKKLYPNYKTKETAGFWQADWFLNINADEIIAAANSVATSDTDTEKVEIDTGITKNSLSKDNENRYNFRLLSADEMKKLIDKRSPTPDDYRGVMAKLLLDLDSVPTGYGFKETDKIKFKEALKAANPKLTIEQIKKALAKIYPNSNNPKSKERWYPEYYININPHEIIRIAKTP